VVVEINNSISTSMFGIALIGTGSLSMRPTLRLSAISIKPSLDEQPLDGYLLPFANVKDICPA